MARTRRSPKSCPCRSLYITVDLCGCWLSPRGVGLVSGSLGSSRQSSQLRLFSKPVTAAIPKLAYWVRSTRWTRSKVSNQYHKPGRLRYILRRRRIYPPDRRALDGRRRPGRHSLHAPRIHCAFWARLQVVDVLARTLIISHVYSSSSVFICAISAR